MTRKQAAEELLRNGPEDEEILMDVWGVDDVKSQAEQDEKEISDEEAMQVLVLVEMNRECYVGINWDVISNEITNVIASRELQAKSG